ncbi:MAG: hypothetical protein MUO67_01930 [Anaerolineales bacterium]|nr:hypothetical protein [Anaerolineales bacterium]
MSYRRILLNLLLLSVITISCRLFTGEDTPASDQGAQQTMDAQASLIAEMEAKQSTLDAQQVDNQQLTADAQATSAANETAAAYNQKTKEAKNSIATRGTQARALLLTKTAEAEMEVEPQVGAFSEKLQVAYDDGVLPTMDGTYHRLEDFDESIAKINRFYWWDTGYAPENFVIRVDAHWDTASEQTNWDQSGCAFVFGLEDEQNYNRTWLGLDGFVNLKRLVKDDWQWIAKRPNGKLSIPEGEAEIMMVVFDKRITIYVNGEKELSEDDPFYTAGKLALSVHSGTNKGFGTQCKMSNIDLMRFE